eukprot:jgi/Orpsp1_1/1179254/evm.model.c7180000068616.1
MIKNTNAKIFNPYGPTESTVICTIKELNNTSEDIHLSIGKPLCNCKIFILDENLKIIPIGVEGEIYIAGYGVSKGYFNQEELTKEKFIPCPYYLINGKPGIMYKTGDLGMWTNEGEIICIGRKDFQVKIRGQRIELSEIETTIKEIKDIDYNIVLDKTKENGEKYLVSYYMSKNDINIRNIKNYLKKKLPIYMIPNYFIRIHELPITSNGKLDRNLLPEPNKKNYINEEYVAPETNIEKILCKIYGEVFNIPLNEVGRMSDFYELGGNSLNAILISSIIEKELNIKIFIKDIMSYSLICDISKYMESIMNDEKNENNKLEIISRYNRKEFPVTSQQLGVYLDSIKEAN